MSGLISAAVARLKTSLANSSLGSSLVAFIAAGAGAVSRTVKDKARDIIDAADYIATPGVSDALDQAGVQAAINQAAVKGGRVRIRKPIRNVWGLSLLTIPANVVVDDERNVDAGHTVIYGAGGDVEMRIHGEAVTGGEGPSFVAVNNAAAGDRTVSFVARYGAGVGASVNSYIHYGVWDGSAWTPDIDYILNGNFGGAANFRSRLRIGAKGAIIINPGGAGKSIDAAAAYAAGYSLVVNRPAQDGGGYQFGVKNGAVEIPQDLCITAANATLRFQNAAGANRFSLLSDFPSVGQLQLYDHVAGVAIATFTSGGAMSLNMKGITFASTAAAGVPTSSLFLDSADGKLKFKDSGGTVNLLY